MSDIFQLNIPRRQVPTGLAPLGLAPLGRKLLVLPVSRMPLMRRDGAPKPATCASQDIVR